MARLAEKIASRCTTEKQYLELVKDHKKLLSFVSKLDQVRLDGKPSFKNILSPSEFQVRRKYLRLRCCWAWNSRRIHESLVPEQVLLQFARCWFFLVWNRLGFNRNFLSRVQCWNVIKQAKDLFYLLILQSMPPKHKTNWFFFECPFKLDSGPVFKFV